MSDRPLADQHAVVTGGAKGIGAAVAAELVRLGARVTLLGRDQGALQQEAERLRQQFGSVVGWAPVDVTDPASVPTAFAAARQQAGGVVILVNNAGAALSAPFGRTDLAMWQSMLSVNLTGTFLCLHEVVSAMVNAGYGRIVNVASTAALKGYPYVSAYVAAKHGVLGLTRALALELATKGVTVNAVCPGYTDTELVARSVQTIVEKTGRDANDARRELARTNPQGRLVQPAEVAQAVGWLCLPESASITGQAIAVAGGEVM